jgi:pyroglutamyl-peptidase
MNLLVTGFGPFGAITLNPSAELAKVGGFPHQVLDVTFQAVDAFIDKGIEDFDCLLSIGVNAGARRFHLETVARNEIASAPDIRGVVQGPGPIEPRLPNHLAATLWPTEMLVETETMRPSVDAGTYLCNYIFYRSIAAFPTKKVGFLHVPSIETVPLETQSTWLRDLLDRLTCNFNR